MAISQKSCSGCSGGSIFHNLRVQIAKKNRPKIDHKTEHKMECILASIIIRLWSGFGLQVRVEKRFKTDVEKHQKLLCFWQEAGPGQEVKEFSHSLVRGILEITPPWSPFSFFLSFFHTISWGLFMIMMFFLYPYNSVIF